MKVTFDSQVELDILNALLDGEVTREEENIRYKLRNFSDYTAENICIDVKRCHLMLMMLDTIQQAEVR